MATRMGLCRGGRDKPEKKEKGVNDHRSKWRWGELVAVGNKEGFCWLCL